MLVDLSKTKSGFSDKLRVITFFIAYAKLIKSKFFFNIYEKKNFECPFKFIDYCSIKNFKFKKIKHINNSIKKYKIIFNSYNSEVNIKNCKKHNNHNKVNNYELLNLWKLSYKNIIPNKFLKKKIDNIKLPKTFISIHIRSTDRMINLKEIFDLQFKDIFFDFQLSLFEKNINKLIIKKTNIKNVYVASDEKKFKSRIINKLKIYGFKVYFNNSSYYSNKFRKTSGEDFLIDLFSISKSEMIFTSVGGGVPYTAKLLSNKKIIIINWINQINILIFLRILVLIIYYCKRLRFIILN